MQVTVIERQVNKVLVQWYDEEEGLLRGLASKSIVKTVNGNDYIDDKFLGTIKRTDENWAKQIGDVHIKAKEIDKILKDYGIFSKEDARKQPQKVQRAIGVLLKDLTTQILK